MKTNQWRRLGALLGTAMLAGSLLATVVAPGVALGVTDTGCAALGGTDGNGALPTCTVGAGVVAVSGTITVNKNLLLQNGAHLDATASGTSPALTLTVNGNLTMDPGSIIEGDDDAPPLVGNAPAVDLTIDVTGNLVMAAGSRISADNNEQGGDSGNIIITVDGDMTMFGTADLVPPFDHCRTSDNGPAYYRYGEFGFPNVYDTATLGARISVHRWGAAGDTGDAGNITITVGNYGVPPTGTLTMERCSLIDVSANGPAGEIKLTAGKIADLDGLVLSESGQSGTGTAQNSPRGGGPIDIRAGCELHVSDTGVISSKGQDPGADLVHLKGCDVLIEGVVQSTAPGAGHVVPVKDGVPTNLCNRDQVAHPLSTLDPNPDHWAEGFTACVRILGENVTIDATGNHNGNVNTNGIRAPMRTWIDIFTTKDIVIKGDTPPDANPTGRFPHWAVEADACPVGSNGSPPCSNSFGGVVTIKAIGGKVVTEGQAILQANATAGGGDGGILTIQAGGSGSGTPGAPDATSNIELDSSFLEANGSTGEFGAGGLVNIKSFNGAITSGGSLTGHIQALGGHAPDASPPPFETRGVVTLEECANTDTYLGTVTANTFNENRSVCGGNPTVPDNGPWDADDLFKANAPIWIACNFEAPHKSGFKFNDVDGDGVYEPPTDSPIADWPINLLKASDNSVVDSTTTLADGTYEFVIADPGSYRVCEGTKPGGYVQTYPKSGATPPAGETITGACPGPNVWGYEFTVTGGENLVGNDFGNRIETVTCKEDPNRASQLTRTVNTSKPLGGGGVPGNPQNYWKVQDAYNAALSGAPTEVVGLFSKTIENLILGGNKALTITQCESAQVTAANSYAPVWKITNTKKLLIIGPDSVGGTIGWELCTGGHELKSIRANGASVAGVRILSNSNNVSFNSVGGNAIGLDVLGSTNTFKAGTIGTNSGNGVHFGPAATGNNLSGATVQDNTGNGFWIEGSSNTVNSVKLFRNLNGLQISGASNTISSVTSESNRADGINVTGRNNQFKDDKESKNAGDGFEVGAGATGNKLTGNGSNASGENTSLEYRFGAAIVSGGSNKKDGSNFLSTAAGTYE